MKTISTYTELLSALQIACIWLFVLSTLRIIRDCALYVLAVLTQSVYRCSSARTRAYQPIIQRYKFALFRRGARAPIYRKKATLHQNDFFREAHLRGKP